MSESYMVFKNPSVCSKNKPLVATHWKILLSKYHVKISAGLYFNCSGKPRASHTTSPVKSKPASGTANSRGGQLLPHRRAALKSLSPTTRRCTVPGAASGLRPAALGSSETSTCSQATPEGRFGPSVGDWGQRRAEAARRTRVFCSGPLAQRAGPCVQHC